MLIKNTTLTPALKAWLEAAHDDGRPGLCVSQRGLHVLVTRADGSEPSASESLEIEALMAAHTVSPLAARAAEKSQS